MGQVLDALKLISYEASYCLFIIAIRPLGTTTRAGVRRAELGGY